MPDPENQTPVQEDPIAARKRLIAEARERQEAERLRIEAEAAALAQEEAAVAAKANTEGLLSFREDALKASAENSAEASALQPESERLAAAEAAASAELEARQSEIGKKEAELAEYSSLLEESRAAGLPDDPAFLERMTEAQTKLSGAQEDLASAQAKNAEITSRISGATGRMNEAEAVVESVVPGRMEDTVKSEQIAAREALEDQAMAEDISRSGQVDTQKETVERSENSETERVLLEAEEFSRNADKYGKTGNEALVAYMQEKHPNLAIGTEEYNTERTNIVRGIEYNEFINSAYFQKHSEVTFDQYKNDPDRMEARMDFAEKAELIKSREPIFVTHVKSGGKWEEISVDLDHLGELDEQTREKLLDGLNNSKDKGEITFGGQTLSKFIEAGIIQPSEAGNYVTKGSYLISNWGGSLNYDAVQKLKTDPSMAGRIKQEVEGAINDLKENQTDPVLKAAYTAKLVRAGIDSPEVKMALSRQGASLDPKVVLEKLIQLSISDKTMVANNRFTARDLGAFAQAGIISHDQFVEIVKRDVDLTRDQGIEANARGSEELRRGNSARLLVQAVDQVGKYKLMGLLTKDEVDQLLQY